MKIHRRLIALVGMGMLLIITIIVLSLQDLTAVFSQATKNMARVTLKVQQVWKVEKEAAMMSMFVQDFVLTGNLAYQDTYESSRAMVRQALNELSSMQLDHRDMALLASIMKDFHALEKKADRIFGLHGPVASQQALARNLIIEMDGLLIWLGKDIDKYKEESGRELAEIEGQIKDARLRVNVVFGIILLASTGFLFGFGIYIHRKVSVPLSDLWEGTEEISRGNLDYQMQLRGEGDVVRLAERFNEMAQKLRQSHADLEQRLLARAQELAALNSVALTLGQAGSLGEVLQKSLEKVLENLSEIEPRGGVFLCEPDGESLRLVAHHGLTPEFTAEEEMVPMGECLCGLVAGTGELLFSEQGCEDPRHTRCAGVKRHSHVIIPIKSRGIVLGVVFLYPTKDFKLNPSDRQMLDTVGAQLGMAVENLRLYGEVKESSEKYWDLFENSRDILFTMDTEGRFTVVNKATEAFLSCSSIELTGMSLLNFLTEEGSRIVTQALAGELAWGRQPIQYEVVRKDGSRAFVEVSARKIIQKGLLTGFHVSARDVTEQKTLRELLVNAERLAAIGQVGIAVRHEINNPLTTVIGNTELLIERYEGKDDELTTRLQVVLNNALRIAEIVKRLQEIRQEKTVEYLKGIRMTDLKQ